ncbi:hypothetical protein KFK09_011717 [Dendrobium nobile]|uniref:Uncharacterized protein n=1 Tax=Dendrobium nobile TaxID=94219 RepID=A0A8T3BGR7_DENNO|nr:hypothetical protein KFK09_011717 [Dendrobium nobile]
MVNVKCPFSRLLFVFVLLMMGRLPFKLWREISLYLKDIWDIFGDSSLYYQIQNYGLPTSFR